MADWNPFPPSSPSAMSGRHGNENGNNGRVHHPPPRSSLSSCAGSSSGATVLPFPIGGEHHHHQHLTTASRVGGIIRSPSNCSSCGGWRANGLGAGAGAGGSESRTDFKSDETRPPPPLILPPSEYQQAALGNSTACRSHGHGSIRNASQTPVTAAYGAITTGELGSAKGNSFTRRPSAPASLVSPDGTTKTGMIAVHRPEPQKAYENWSAFASSSATRHLPYQQQSVPQRYESVRNQDPTQQRLVRPRSGGGCMASVDTTSDKTSAYGEGAAVRMSDIGSLGKFTRRSKSLREKDHHRNAQQILGTAEVSMSPEAYSAFSNAALYAPLAGLQSSQMVTPLQQQSQRVHRKHQHPVYQQTLAPPPSFSAPVSASASGSASPPSSAGTGKRTGSDNGSSVSPQGGSAWSGDSRSVPGADAVVGGERASSSRSSPSEASQIGQQQRTGRTAAAGGAYASLRFDEWPSHQQRQTSHQQHPSTRHGSGDDRCCGCSCSCSSTSAASGAIDDGHSSSASGSGLFSSLGERASTELTTPDDDASGGDRGPGGRNSAEWQQSASQGKASKEQVYVKAVTAQQAQVQATKAHANQVAAATKAAAQARAAEAEATKTLASLSLNAKQRAKDADTLGLDGSTGFEGANETQAAEMEQESARRAAALAQRHDLVTKANLLELQERMLAKGLATISPAEVMQLSLKHAGGYDGRQSVKRDVSPQETQPQPQQQQEAPNRTRKQQDQQQQHEQAVGAGSLSAQPTVRASSRGHAATATHGQTLMRPSTLSRLHSGMTERTERASEAISNGDTLSPPTLADVNGPRLHPSQPSSEAATTPAAQMTDPMASLAPLTTSPLPSPPEISPPAMTPQSQQLQEQPQRQSPPVRSPSLMSEASASGASSQDHHTDLRNSWKSFLPDDDPLRDPARVSDGSLVSNVGSSAGAGPTGTALGAGSHPGMGERRNSNASQVSSLSSYSLPGPSRVGPGALANVAGSAASSSSIRSPTTDRDSWRSFLVDSTSASNTAAALQNGSLTLPPDVMHQIDAQGRRHASFSSYNPTPPVLAWASHPMQSAMSATAATAPWTAGGGNNARSRIRSDTAATGTAMRTGGRPSIAPRVGSGGAASVASSGTSAMGDESERESWPSSKMAPHQLAKYAPVSAGPDGGVAVAGCPGDDSREERAGGPAAANGRDGLGEPSSSLPVGVAEYNATTTVTTHEDKVHSPAVSPGLPVDEGEYVTTTTTTTTTTTCKTSFRTQAPRPDMQSRENAPAASRPRPTVDTSSAVVDTPLESGSSSASAPRSATCLVSPLSPPSLPFLENRPAPAETSLEVETRAQAYILKTKLPGFSLDCITLAAKHHRTLHIVADKWDAESGGHFERRVTFGPDAQMRAIKAQFDGDVLLISIPRRNARKA